MKRETGEKKKAILHSYIHFTVLLCYILADIEGERESREQKASSFKVIVSNLNPNSKET